MRLKIECQQLEKETRGKEGSRGKDAEPSLKLNTSKLLIPFDDRKDDLDAYIRRFESLAESQKWPESQWSTALATCLSGEALSVYGRLPPGDAADYSKVKTALLKRFRFTADGFRDKFDSGNPRTVRPQLSSRRVSATISIAGSSCPIRNTSSKTSESS